MNFEFYRDDFFTPSADTTTMSQFILPIRVSCLKSMNSRFLRMISLLLGTDTSTCVLTDEVTAHNTNTFGNNVVVKKPFWKVTNFNTYAYVYKINHTKLGTPICAINKTCSTYEIKTPKIQIYMIYVQVALIKLLEWWRSHRGLWVKTPWPSFYRWSKANN